MLLTTLMLILVLALGVWAILIFNKLVGLRQMANNGWADIEVQLKRRADLIPQIVKTVKAYAAHERRLFEDVIDARNRALSAGDDIGARGTAEGAVARGASRLFALAEDYPELKANENFLDLQNELSETEDKIEMARRFYNGAVRELNTKIETVPSNLIAGPFGFRQKPYFEIDESDAVVPTVEFDA
ncbi:LemA family protein [Algimonas porphyrae]|uniref:Membrane protein n=1 Tax=Algimonas porphyrae TaxID=1128113 RepID=A0ABQ5V028_9PROT|nr:LemA family protein [Algimonas porphyrae]GLQ20895.1 membrane protein [Algimonas porphyrae]